MMFLINFHLSYNLNAPYYIHTRPTQVTIMNQINPILTLPTYLRSISITAYHLQPGLPSGPFTSGLNENVLTFLICHMSHVLSDLLDSHMWSSHAVFFYTLLHLPLTFKHSPQCPLLTSSIFTHPLMRSS